MFIIISVPDHLADDVELTVTPSISAPGEWRVVAEDSTGREHGLERGVPVELGADISMVRDGVRTTIRRADA